MTGQRIVLITHDAYKKSLDCEITNDGLRGSIKKRLDNINELCGNMPYLPHREIQENLAEIYDLLTIFAERQK